MKREYTVPNDLSRLMDEILVAVPISRRVRTRDDGTNEALLDHLRVSGLGERIIVEFADDIDAAMVDAVVAQHDPNTPRPPTPREAAVQRLLTAAAQDTRLNDILVATGLKEA